MKKKTKNDYYSHKPEDGSKLPPMEDTEEELSAAEASDADNAVAESAIESSIITDDETALSNALAEAVRDEMEEHRDTEADPAKPDAKETIPAAAETGSRETVPAAAETGSKETVTAAAETGSKETVTAAAETGSRETIPAATETVSRETVPAAAETGCKDAVTAAAEAGSRETVTAAANETAIPKRNGIRDAVRVPTERVVVRINEPKPHKTLADALTAVWGRILDGFEFIGSKVSDFTGHSADVAEARAAGKAQSSGKSSRRSSGSVIAETMTDGATWHLIGEEGRKGLSRIAFFPLLFIYLELMFHLYTYMTLDSHFLYPTLFAIAYGLFVAAMTTFPSKKANRIVAWISFAIVAVSFCLQTVYRHIFKTYISIYSVMQNAGDASEFWKEALNGILACLPGLMLFAVFPAIFLGMQIKRGYVAASLLDRTSDYNTPARPAAEQTRSEDDVQVFASRQPRQSSQSSVQAAAVSQPAGASSAPISFTANNLIAQACILVAAVLMFFISLLTVKAGGTEEFDAYDLYHNDFIMDLGVERLGVMTSVKLDFRDVFFGTGKQGSEIITDDSVSGLSGLVIKPAATPSVIPEQPVAQAPEVQTSEGIDTSEPDPEATPTPSPSPTPTPIDRSPRVLDIDFRELAATESNSAIRSLHEYFATAETTNRNEYTGMFKGYNFIYLCCEGFSSLAVDEKLTPTLYKLIHSGFVFNNFYNPIWNTSTSDGEYVQCLGLLPYSTNSFKRTKQSSLPFSFGWQFQKLGYTTIAYHDHSYTYYDRNDTHPNMGYIFRSINGTTGEPMGLTVTKQWPESDIEMMESSIPQYINDEHFHIYYMTVSGHLEYNFSGNRMARKNRALVDGLDLSDASKAYLACNIELDRALEYLIRELESAGRLDDTVIAFGGDHYAYGLTNNLPADEQYKYINELLGHEVEPNFELYKSNFVIWNSRMSEPVIINKYCSSIDMVPTLSNLFDLDYDSRLLSGQDILSDSPALVIFNNKSFITDYCMYNSKTKEVTMLQDVVLPDNYIKSVTNIVKNKFTIAQNVLLNDYYSYLPLTTGEVNYDWHYYPPEQPDDRMDEPEDEQPEEHQ